MTIRTTVLAKPILILGLLLLLLLLAGACSSDDSTGMPVPVVSEADIEQLQTEAVRYAEDHIAAWPDVDTNTAKWAEDFRFADPTWGDLMSGRDGIVALFRQWEEYTNYTIDVTDIYVSTDGAAYEEVWPNLQPPIPLPPDPPVASGLTVYRFRDGEAASSELWYRASDNDFYGIACFAVDGCPALQDTVDRYVDAWSSHDRDAIAALYSDDAAFVDGILGFDAQSADAIGDLADQRFGSAENLTIEVLDLYAWTNGTRPPTETHPEAGMLIGVAIHYRAEADNDGTTETQEGVTVLKLAEHTETSIDADPEGLIHDEEVYHKSADLLTGSGS